MIGAARRLHRRVTATGDSGTTMIELFVAMIIMGIAGSIFVGAMVTLFRATNDAQAVTNTATNDNQAYQALDKLVRYAEAISPPDVGAATKDWYVELSDTTSGVEVCTQLRLDITTQQLQTRTWTVTSPTTLTGLTTFVPIASNITNGAAAAGTGQPFLVKTPFNTATATSSASPSTSVAGPTAQHQELVISIESISGPANGLVKSQSSYTLTALNSTSPVRTGTICQQAGRP